ncbi:hypothetical protein PR048_000613 [Dryococelus australis]|uniref:Uncharacterized protein n=1 Tax=Dryococelus australis TaxID=614101 RepID=A0ABQ9IF51_9NEOP|nr:hypothetical protein PR048_000613 [Dryococelus australis]
METGIPRGNRLANFNMSATFPTSALARNRARIPLLGGWFSSTSPIQSKLLGRGGCKADVLPHDQTYLFIPTVSKSLSFLSERAVQQPREAKEICSRAENAKCLDYCSWQHFPTKATYEERTGEEDDSSDSASGSRISQEQRLAREIWLSKQDFRGLGTNSSTFRGVAMTTRLPPRCTGLDSRRGRSQIFAFGVRAGRCRWSVGFLGDLLFSPPLHYGAAPYLPRLTLIGSQDLDVKSRPNLSIKKKLLRFVSVEAAVQVSDPASQLGDMSSIAGASGSGLSQLAEIDLYVASIRRIFSECSFLYLRVLSLLHHRPLFYVTAPGSTLQQRTASGDTVEGLLVPSQLSECAVNSTRVADFLEFTLCEVTKYSHSFSPLGNKETQERQFLQGKTSVHCDMKIHHLNTGGPFHTSCCNLTNSNALQADCMPVQCIEVRQTPTAKVEIESNFVVLSGLRFCRGDHAPDWLMRNFRRNRVVAVLTDCRVIRYTEHGSRCNGLSALLSILLQVILKERRCLIPGEVDCLLAFNTLFTCQDRARELRWRNLVDNMLFKISSIFCTGFKHEKHKKLFVPKHILRRERGGGVVVIRLLASQLCELGPIPGGATPRYLHVRIVPNDATGRRAFSGIFRFPRPFIPTLLRPHLASPLSALKTLILKAAQIS